MSHQTDPELVELVTLLLLDRSPQPVGAARLTEAWRQAGLPGAEATAGRYLRQLDTRGLTRPHHTTKGRALTDQGKERLHQLLARRRQDEQGAELWRAVNTTEVADLVDLLRVRRAVETEAARLAATRATDEELDRLAVAAAAHVVDAGAGHETTTPSMHFHRLVAEASHNRLLIAVALLLLDPANDPLEKVLEYIALDAGATLEQVADHGVLVDALRRRDAPAAEALMRAHMDRLIGAVEAYRDRSARPADRPDTQAEVAAASHPA